MEVCHMTGLAWYAKNLWKSEESVGVKLSAQCAKEQAECIYSPTDRRFSQKPCGLPISKKTRDSSGRRRWALTIAQWPCGVLFAKNTSPPVAVGRMEQDGTG